MSSVLERGKEHQERCESMRQTRRLQIVKNKDGVWTRKTQGQENITGATAHSRTDVIISYLENLVYSLQVDFAFVRQFVDVALHAVDQKNTVANHLQDHVLLIGNNVSLGLVERATEVDDLNDHLLRQGYLTTGQQRVREKKRIILQRKTAADFFANSILSLCLVLKTILMFSKLVDHTKHDSCLQE